jgi:hypothetical protein
MLFGSLYVLFLLLPHVDSIWTKFDFVRPWSGAWGSEGNKSFTKISPADGNGPDIVGANSRFGWSLSNIGDLNGDGIDDLVVGAPGEDSVYITHNNTYNGTVWNNVTTIDNQENTGAIYVMLMNSDGEVDSWTRISGEVNGGPHLYRYEEFGYSVSAIGDLDSDGFIDIAVGAPGVLISSTYIIYLNGDGSAKDYKLIRGHYSGTTPVLVTNGTYPTGAYVPNGPDLGYQCRFGVTVMGLGDWDLDGVNDLAVASQYGDTGGSVIYFLYLYSNGTVKSVTNITSSGGITYGGDVPDLESRGFVGFGSSMLLFPDHDGDGVPELVIGAKDLDDALTSNYKSGVVFFCFMNRDGTIKSHSRISELSGGNPSLKLNGEGKVSGTLPLVTEDNCGQSLAQIGDINHDGQKQQRPLMDSEYLLDPDYPDRKPLNDLIMGCPQTEAGVGTGRIFLIFLSSLGAAQAYREIPSDTDIGIAPNFASQDKVGHSLAAYMDLDGNGIKEIVVGAPGTSTNGTESGAIYIFYLRRRRWHAFVPDTRAWLCSIIIPPGLFVFFCISGIIYFFYKFRRKPDKIELMVMKAGVEVGEDKIKKKKKKKNKNKEGESKVFVDDDDF